MLRSFTLREDGEDGQEEEDRDESKVISATQVSGLNLSAHAFYENVLEGVPCRLVIGGGQKSSVPFENFSSASHGIIEKQDVLTLSKHFKSILTGEDCQEEGSWEELEPILLQVLQADSPLGICLLLGELNSRLDQEVQVVVEKNPADEEKGVTDAEGSEEEGWDDAELDIDDEQDEETLESKQVNLVDNCLAKMTASDKVAAGLLALLSRVLPRVKSLQVTTRQMAVLADKPDKADSLLAKFFKVVKDHKNHQENESDDIENEKSGDAQ